MLEEYEKKQQEKSQDAEAKDAKKNGGALPAK
jgi:hypothetical protein